MESRKWSPARPKGSASERRGAQLRTSNFERTVLRSTFEVRRWMFEVQSIEQTAPAALKLQGPSKKARLEMARCPQALAVFPNAHGAWGVEGHHLVRSIFTHRSSSTADMASPWVRAAHGDRCPDTPMERQLVRDGKARTENPGRRGGWIARRNWLHRRPLPSRRGERSSPRDFELWVRSVSPSVHAAV